MTTYRNFSNLLNIDFFQNPDSTILKTNYINLEDELYNNVFEKIPNNIDLPKVQLHYTISEKISSGATKILGLENSNSLLNKYTTGKGKVFLMTAPLNEKFTNFGKHAIFVPTIYKIVLLSFSDEKLYHIIGKDELLELNYDRGNKEEILHITDEKGEFDIIPEIRKTNSKTQLLLHNQINKAGNYKVLSNEKAVYNLSLNYNKNESDLEIFNKNEINEMITGTGSTNIQLLDTGQSNLTSLLEEINEGKRYWKTCIMLVLLFFGIEIILIKFWKS